MCNCASNRKRYRDNPELRERTKKRAKEWDKDNVEWVKERRRKYYKENAEHIRARAQKWREDNPLRARAQVVDWLRRNPGRMLEYGRRRRMRKRGVPVSFTAEDWEQVLEFFEGRCAYCGEPGELERDHFLPLILGGGYVRGNIIPSCRSCNATKSSKHPRLFVEEGRLKQPYRQLLVKLCYA